MSKHATNTEHYLLSFYALNLKCARCSENDLRLMMADDVWGEGYPWAMLNLGAGVSYFLLTDFWVNYRCHCKHRRLFPPCIPNRRWNFNRKLSGSVRNVVANKILAVVWNWWIREIFGGATLMTLRQRPENCWTINSYIECDRILFDFIVIYLDNLRAATCKQ